MNFTQSIAALALVPIVAPPAFANPPCRTCAPKLFYPVSPKIVYRDRIKYVPKPFIVEKPVLVRDQISYLSAIIPSNTYQFNITTPPAQVQQAALSATFGSAQTVGVAGYGQAQQYAQPDQKQFYANPPQQQPQQQRQATADERLDRIEAAIAKLCNELANGGNGHNGNGEPIRNGNGNGTRVPLGLSRCATCHSETSAATEGGGFKMWARGSLVPLSVPELHAIGKHLRAGTMPPANNKFGVKPLTDQEYAAVQAWIDRQE